MISGILIALALICALVFITFIWIQKRKKNSDEISLGESDLPTFFSKKPITETEGVIYGRLVEALPECIVLAQVQVSQIVGIKKGKGWQAWFNKISRKSVDFLVCLKDFTIVAAIELDDASHDNESRKAKDADKDIALSKAGIKILRWKVKEMPSIEEIKTIFHE